MKVISWLKYFVFLLLIILVLWVQAKAQSAFSTDYSSTGKINYLLYTAGMLLPILVGVIIGLESFLNERLKVGRWKLNIPKLILFILPSLYAASLYFITLINNQSVYNIMIKPFTTFFGSGAFVPMFEVLLGYSIITLMYKAEPKNLAVEEGNVVDNADYELVNNESIDGSSELISESDDAIVDNEIENAEIMNEDSIEADNNNKSDVEETNK